jgi:hypothetical protein
MSAGFFPSKKEDVESFIRIAEKIYKTKEFQKAKSAITHAIKRIRATPNVASAGRGLLITM